MQFKFNTGDNVHLTNNFIQSLIDQWGEHSFNLNILYSTAIVDNQWNQDAITGIKCMRKCMRKGHVEGENLYSLQFPAGNPWSIDSRPMVDVTEQDIV